MKRFLILLLCLFVGDSFASGIGTTATAPCDNDTLSKYSGTANVEINWEPNVIQLGWYDGDTKLNVQNSSQSCTYDGVVTVPPQPTKPGYTFNGWKVIRVPDGYTELEYIENTGYSYIDTGLTVNDGPITATAVFEPTNFAIVAAGDYSAIFGRNSNFQAGYTSSGKAHIGNEESSGVYFAMNQKVTVSGTLSSSSTHPYYVNNVATGLTRTFGKDLQLWLFTSDVSGHYARGRMYSFVATRNNTEIMRLLPAKRNSDNVLGMWDSISGNFFTNIGSGTFTAGPVVQ